MTEKIEPPFPQNHRVGVRDSCRLVVVLKKEFCNVGSIGTSCASFSENMRDLANIHRVKKYFSAQVIQAGVRLSEQNQAHLQFLKMPFAIMSPSRARNARRVI